MGRRRIADRCRHHGGLGHVGLRAVVAAVVLAGCGGTSSTGDATTVEAVTEDVTEDVTDEVTVDVTDGVAGNEPDDDRPVEDGQDATTQDAASSQEEPPDAGPPGSTWSQVTHDEDTFGGNGHQQMLAVTAGGPGLVAVGDDRSMAEGRHSAAVWTSQDGTTWTRVPHDEDTFGGDGHQQMLAVTAGGPGLVAVGTDEGRGSGAAAVWTSPDGTAWTRIPHDAETFGGDERQQMLAVTTGGPGLVAVGFDFGVGAAAVWTSPDATTWTRTPHDEDTFGGEGDQGMLAVTTGGPGLVAVGFDFGVGAAAVWTSPDATTWTRIPHDAETFGSEQGATQMVAVSAGGPGLIAVGPDLAPGAAIVWTSPDGESWTRVPHDPATFGGGPDLLEMRAVTAAGPGAVAVGRDFAAVNGVVWTSPDGVHWSRNAHDEAVFGAEGAHRALNAVIPGGPGLVAVGQDVWSASVWTSP